MENEIKKKKRFEVNPLEGNILKGMIIFSIPIVLVQLLQVLFQQADTIIVARFVSDLAMTSVGVTASPINLIISGALGLSAGVSVVLGQAFGSNDSKTIHNVMHSITLTGLIIGIIIASIAIPCAEYILNFMEVKPELMEDATLYFRIYFLSIPFNISFNFMSSALQAKGDTFHPLIFQLIAGLINVLLNLLFVICFKWAVAGVAIATVISQAFSAIGVFIYLTKRDDDIKIHLKELKAFKYLKNVFIIGLPSSIGWIAMDVSNVLISRAINTFDTIAVTGNTAAASVEGFMYLAFAGFGNACVVYISQNYGAKNYDRIKKTFFYTGITVFILGEIIGTTIYLCATPLLSIYTDNVESIECGVTRIFYFGCFFGLCGTMNSLSGSVRGLGYSKVAMAISLVWAGLFRASFVLIVNEYIHTLEAIYIAYPICWTGTTISNIIAFIICYKKKYKIYLEELAIEENLLNLETVEEV